MYCLAKNKYKKPLTEKHSQERRLVEEPFQHAAVDGLDFVGQFPILIVYQPLQDGIFVP